MDDPNRHVDQNAGQRAFSEVDAISEEINDIFDERAPIQVIDYYPLIMSIDWPYNNEPAAARNYQHIDDAAVNRDAIQRLADDLSNQQAEAQDMARKIEHLKQANKMYREKRYESAEAEENEAADIDNICRSPQS
ncbi:hypothetical protein DL769_007330 [Monosporascus sp. CRB-8-3]|nr:hypothetical protein DL769_007330 [Monosporascus sp. CRB-8-3]